nr:penicillin-binding transpeptidase domain-containing protein [bacterium]
MNYDRYKILVIAGVGVISLLFGRIVHLQVFKGNAFARQAFHSHFRRVMVQPRRGAIWDRAGRLLAVTLTADSLCADPVQIVDPDDLADRLAKIIPVSRKVLTDRLARTDRRFMWLHRGLLPEQSERVRKLDARGLFFRRERRRVYPAGDDFGQLLGFCSIDGRGLEGFEAAMEAMLSGEPGEELQAFDALARPYSGDSIVIREAIQGDDLHLTVDSAIQHFASAELRRVLNEEQALWGAAVVMDVHSGDVLAMVTEPGFNPHRFSDVPADRRRNRCTTHLLEPGSTFKAVTLAAAIETDQFRLTDRVFCENGRYHVDRTEFSDWKAFGELTAEDVIAYSSNIGTIKMAHAVGGPELVSLAGRLGIGRMEVEGLPGMEAAYIRQP